MEIVSEPDIRCAGIISPSCFASLMPYSSPEEAADYVRTLQALLRAVGSSDGNMEAVYSYTIYLGTFLLTYVRRALSVVTSMFLSADSEDHLGHAVR